MFESSKAEIEYLLSNESYGQLSKGIKYEWNYVIHFDNPWSVLYERFAVETI